ncbi:MAG TPA: hydrogenase maturation protease [Noviherbaspirillum sp.]
MRAPTLIIGYGNPSRGDDGLGPAAAARVEQRAAQGADWGAIEVLTDFQLQIEFVTDLAWRQRVLFIDADASGPEPYAFMRLEARQEAAATTHALSPASLLSVYRRFHRQNPPPAYLLAIRGYCFELGSPMSAEALANLDAAMSMLDGWLACHDVQGEMQS